MLQGKVAGLNIIRTTSDPTSTGYNIQIRGFSTLDKGAGSSPLFIVDGVPVSSIDNISPNEIASMDVLKDGSAAAIYGTRGTIIALVYGEIILILFILLRKSFR